MPSMNSASLTAAFPDQIGRHVWMIVVRHSFLLELRQQKFQDLEMSAEGSSRSCVKLTRRHVVGPLQGQWLGVLPSFGLALEVEQRVTSLLCPRYLTLLFCQRQPYLTYDVAFAPHINLYFLPAEIMI